MWALVGLVPRDCFRSNLEIEIPRDPTNFVKVHYRSNLDLPPCRGRRVDILRARDRPKRLTGPLTAPRGARPEMALPVEYAQHRPHAARRRERPRGPFGTIPGSQNIYTTPSARWEV